MENLQKCQKLAPDWFIPVGPGFTRRRVPEAEIGAILPPPYLQVLVVINSYKKLKKKKRQKLAQSFHPPICRCWCKESIVTDSYKKN